MVYLCLKPFPADGIDFEPGQPVPAEVLRGNAANVLQSSGHVIHIPDTLYENLPPLEEVPKTTPAAERTASQEGVNALEVEPSGEQLGEPVVTQEDVREAAIAQQEHDAKVEEDLASARDSEAGEIKATNAAIDLAEKESVPLGDVRGTGQEGQITVTDVREYRKEKE